MKRFTLLALAVLLVAGVAQAAPIATTAGSHALVFEFSGLSNLGLSGYMGGIGFRHYLQDDMAIRPGIDVGLSSQKTKGTGGLSDDKRTNTTLGLSLAFEKHMSGQTSISPYVGAGANVGITHMVHEPPVLNSPPAGTILKETGKGTNFGVFGLIGFEWGLVQSLTLGGEYRLGLGFGSSSNETERQGQPTVKANEVSSFNLGISTASVFLSVAW